MSTTAQRSTSGDARPSGSIARGAVVMALSLGAAAVVGILAATWSLVGLAVLVAMVALIVLGRWRDAVPVLAVALIYSNAVVIFAQRGALPTSAGAVLLAALGLAVVREALQSRTVPTAPPSLSLVFAFAAAQCLSGLFAVAPAVAQTEVFSSLSEGVALYLLVAYAVVETKTLMSVVSALLVVGATLGLLSMIQHFTGDYTNTFFGFAGVSNAAVPGSSASPADLQPRLNGNIGETNRYGQILAVLIPLAAVRFASTPSRPVKILTIVAAALIGGGIVFTYSRGTAVALLGVVITLTLMGWLKVRWTAAMVAVAAVVVLSTPGYADRLSSITSIVGATELQGSSQAADNAVRGRTTEVITALLVFADHPVVGVGPGNFPLVYPQYAEQVGIRPRLEEREAHNLYAGIAAETGMLGLTAFVLMLVRLLTGLGDAAIRWESVDRTRALLARGFFAAVLVYAFSGMFLHLSYVRYFWLLIGLAAAAARLPGAEFRPFSLPLRRRRRKTEASDPAMAVV